MSNDINTRFSNYNKNHCWQYEIRLKNRIQDLLDANLTEEDVQNIKIQDIEFAYVDKSDKIKCTEIVNFIKKHEWLGNMPLRPTHRFTARYKDILIGVIVMATPNTFNTKLLGKDNVHLEKLISRGACISWSPKNLASSLLMYSIKYMVKNTHYRIFTAYSDIEAKELGTIYQACNFYYLGKQSGTKKMYRDPNGSGNWFSDRSFRIRSAYKRYAKKLNIKWEDNWQDSKDRILWNNMPKDIEKSLRQASKDYAKTCESREVPTKHKYCYVLGRTKKETNKLKKLFKSNIKVLEYPKNRGE
jgi:hypothetical protein